MSNYIRLFYVDVRSSLSIPQFWCWFSQFPLVIGIRYNNVAGSINLDPLHLMWCLQKLKPKGVYISQIIDLHGGEYRISPVIFKLLWFPDVCFLVSKCSPALIQVITWQRKMTGHYLQQQWPKFIEAYISLPSICKLKSVYILMKNVSMSDVNPK